MFFSTGFLPQLLHPEPSFIVGWIYIKDQHIIIVMIDHLSFLGFRLFPNVGHFSS